MYINVCMYVYMCMYVLCMYVYVGMRVCVFIYIRVRFLLHTNVPSETLAIIHVMNIYGTFLRYIELERSFLSISMAR